MNITPEQALEILHTLQALVVEGSEADGESLVIMWDREDGFFLSTVDNGCRHHPVKEPEPGAKRETLAEAIVAAARWHNAERLNHWRSYLKPIKEPS